MTFIFHTCIYLEQIYLDTTCIVLLKNFYVDSFLFVINTYQNGKC